MKALRRLLNELSRSWFLDPKTIPTLFVAKGEGAHTKMTIRDGELYLHSVPYYPNIPNKQTIALDDMTFQELADLLNIMGYTTVFTAEATKKNLPSSSALNLYEVDNVSFAEGHTFDAFTSNLWRVLYPIARILSEADMNVDSAIEQLPLPSAKGRWLDFWVGFFKIKRLDGESDELLLRRTIMTIANVKSNNVAIEELVSYYINATVSVEDYAPSYMEIVIEPQFMDSASKVRDIVDLLKSAGVDYFLNYAKKYEESYPSFFRSKNGRTFRDMNRSYKGVNVQFPAYLDDYSQIPEELRNAFIMNISRLCGDNRLSLKEKRFTEKLTMVMTQNGQVIKQM